MLKCLCHRSVLCSLRCTWPNPQLGGMFRVKFFCPELKLSLRFLWRKPPLKSPEGKREVRLSLPAGSVLITALSGYKQYPCSGSGTPASKLHSLIWVSTGMAHRTGAFVLSKHMSRSMRDSQVMKVDEKSRLSPKPSQGHLEGQIWSKLMSRNYCKASHLKVTFLLKIKLY